MNNDDYHTTCSSSLPKLPSLFLLLGIAMVLLATVPSLVLQPGLSSPPPMGKFLNGTLPTATPSQVIGYEIIEAYPNLEADTTLVFEPEPGTNRIIIGSRNGLYEAFNNNPNVTSSDKKLFLDLRSRTTAVWDGGNLGMTFHPEFLTNPSKNFIYIWYCARVEGGGFPPSTGNIDQTLSDDVFLRLSRFEVSPDGQGDLVADKSSEFIMINIHLFDSSHRGGGMAWDSEGNLLVTLGEQFNGPSAQNITNTLQGGWIRIDVDQRGGAISHLPRRIVQIDPSYGALQNDGFNGHYEGWEPASQAEMNDPVFLANPDKEFTGRGYYIPNTNPNWGAISGTLSAGDYFEEYCTIGNRNPHRMTQDPVSGRYWSGEVGGGQREEINVLETDELTVGINYGWPGKEGNLGNFPGSYMGTQKDPVTDFLRSEANAIIGGYVYNGSELPGLVGKYICGGYSQKRIFAVSYEEDANGKVSQVSREVIATFDPGSLVTFGQDHNGELYLCRQANDAKIYKLRAIGTAQPAPARLSDIAVFQTNPTTGNFSGMNTLIPQTGLIPYELNVPFWSDGAIKRRLLAIPNTNEAGEGNGIHDRADEQVIFSENGEWQFPIGAVFIKQFDLPVDDTDPSAVERVETRFVVHGEDGKYYYLTYKWLADGSDALLLESGMDSTFTINTATGSRTQVWQYPGRDECLFCHNEVAGSVLGANTRQLNREIDYSDIGGTTGNQLETYNQLGIFSGDPFQVSDIPNFLTLSPIEGNGSLEDRARSYLDANCGYCHRPGNNRGVFDARYTTSLGTQDLIYGTLNNDLGDPNNRVIVPQDITHSVAHLRMISTDSNIQMPPLSRNVVDEGGAQLIEDWINSLDPSGCRLASFTLVNATNNSDILVLEDGMTLLTGDLPTSELNIRANTIPSTVGSVAFSLSGPVNASQTEGVTPYALFGDSGGNYNAGSLPVGTYTLTAQPYEGPGTANPCVPLTISFTLTDEDPCIGFSPSFVGRDPSDCGLSDGEIIIGGLNPSAEYQIGLGGTTVFNESADLNGEILLSNLGGGTFDLNVAETNGNQCSVSSTVILKSPSIPLISNILTTDQSDCEVLDGTITINASGSNLEYSIGGAFQGNNVFTDLAEGNYTVTVREALQTNCEVSAQASIDIPQACNGGGGCTAPVNLALNKPAFQSSTRGDGVASLANDGNTLGNDNWGADADMQHTETEVTPWWQVDLETLATLQYVEIYNRTDTRPFILGRLNNFYVYASSSPIDGSRKHADLSSDPAISHEFFSGNAGQQETIQLGGVQGRYVMIKLTTSNGPLHVAEVEVYGCDGPPPTCDIDLVSIASSDESDCAAGDGTITTTATGSVEYSIDGGTSYQASNTFTGLSAGSYNVVIRKVGQPSCNESAENPVVIAAPATPTITNVASTDQSDCEVTDGTLTILATGANLEYSIGGAFQASNGFTGLSEGTYTVTVRDGSNTACVATSSATVGKPAGCESGECTTPFNLALNKPASQSTIRGDGIPSFANDGNTLGDDNWGADANMMHTDNGDTQLWWAVDLGSVATLQHVAIYNRTDTRPFILGRLSNFYVHVSSTPIDGSRTNADLSSDPSITSEFFSGPAGQLETIQLGGVLGQYVMIKLDGSGPLHLAEVEVYGCDDTPPPVCDIVLASVASTNENDCGAGDGSITINATGNVEYSINGGSSYQASNTFSGLSAGSYNVIIRKIGLASCTESEANPVIISAPSAPGITNVSTTDQSDCEVLDGTITITATGSNLEYSIGGAFQPSNTFIGLAEGTYTLTVRDASNTACVATSSATIGKPAGCGEVCTVPINLALESGVSASQSTTYGNGEASFAIDGNTSGNDPWGADADLQHTTTAAGAWLKVDLGQPSELSNLVIHNRTNPGIYNRLNNFFIFFSDQDIDGNRPSGDLETDPNIEHLFFPGSAGAIEIIGLGQAQARYVVIKMSNILNVRPLHIAELEIYGCPVVSGGNNSAERFASPEENGLEEGINLSVFPNPYRENFTLEIDGELEEGAFLLVSNSLGQTISRMSIPVSRILEFGENLPMGVYWIQLFNGDSVERIKVMKAR